MKVREMLDIDVIGREIDTVRREAQASIIRAMFATARDIDPEAFPKPLPEVRIPYRLAWRVGTVRFDSETEARETADKYDARVRRVRVRRVPKGTAIVRKALAMLDAALRGVPAWDVMEVRRRVAQRTFDARRRLNLSAWIPDPNCPPNTIFMLGGVQL